MTASPRAMATALGLTALLSASCSEDDPLPPLSTGNNSITTFTGGSQAGTGDEAGTNDGDGGEDSGACAQDDTPVDFSYLWVANTDEGSVSKVNAQTLVEEARYRTGPANVEHSPSRTTVSLDGRFALVGNRLSASVVLVAAEVGDCVDTNGDQAITTSQSSDDLLDWGSDECVLWSRTLPDVGSGIESGPRGMTFDPGELNLETCTHDAPKVWVGWRGSAVDEAHIGRLSPSDGAVEAVIDIPDWALQTPDWAPYGAAYDGDGGVWFTALYGEILRVDTGDLEVQRWIPPYWTSAYGMAVDADAKVWIGGCPGPVSVFDPDTEIISAILDTDACHRGVAADSQGNVWVAMNDPCGLVQIDREQEQVVQTLTAEDFDGECSVPVGVSIDADGFVWMVDQLGWAWKIDPDTLDKEKLTIPGNHYTYSDMTGGGLNAVVYPQ